MYLNLQVSCQISDQEFEVYENIQLAGVLCVMSFLSVHCSCFKFFDHLHSTIPTSTNSIVRCWLYVNRSTSVHSPIDQLFLLLLNARSKTRTSQVMTIFRPLIVTGVRLPTTPATGRTARYRCADHFLFFDLSYMYARALVVSYPSTTASWVYRRRHASCACQTFEARTPS